MPLYSIAVIQNAERSELSYTTVKYWQLGHLQPVSPAIANTMLADRHFSLILISFTNVYVSCSE